MSLYGSRNLSSGTIEIANPDPKLFLTKQYDMLFYTSTSEQAMHFALGRHTIPLITLCNQNVGINGGMSNVSNLNVGINTLNPTSHLHVTGNTRVVYTGSNQLWLQNPVASNTTLEEPIEIYFDRTYSTSTAYSSIGHRAGKGCNYFYVRTHTGAGARKTDQLVILPNGNVGMGQVAPIANLHVNGTIKTDSGRLWMSNDAVFDSISGNFEVRKTNYSNANSWEPMIHYTATSSSTPCNLWIRGTASINSSNYPPARMTIDGPRFYIRNSNVQGGEARIWISNNQGRTTNGMNEWFIGQCNAAAHDLRISRNSNNIEQHMMSLTPHGDLILGSNQLNPLGRFHVVTSNLGHAIIRDTAVSNVNMPTLQLSSNNGPEGAITFSNQDYALYRRGTDLRIRNNDYDRLTIQTTSLATYNGPFRLFGCNVEHNIGELQFGDSNHALYRTLDDSLRIRTSNTSRLTVKYNGLVGISNDNPQELLDLYGSMTYGKGPTDQLSYIRAYTSDTNNDKILFSTHNRKGAKLAHGQQSNYSLDFYAGHSNMDLGLFTFSTGSQNANSITGFTRRLVISNSNGNTTIGSNLNPPVKLLVEGEHWADFIKGSNVGSAQRPTYSWTNDPDTGLYNIAPNAIGFATEGYPVMTLSNDRLGIGLYNTTPNAQLHVSNDFQLSHSQTKTYTVSLSPGANDFSHICTITSSSRQSALVKLTLTHTKSQSARDYVIPLKYHGTSGQWNTAIPTIATTLPEPNVLLDVCTVNNTTTLRLRRESAIMPPSLAAIADPNFTIMFAIYHPANDTITCEADTTVGTAPSTVQQGIPEWAASIDGISNENIYSLKTDTRGNVYCTVIHDMTSAAKVYDARNQLSPLQIPTTTSRAATVVKYNSVGTAIMSVTIDKAVDDDHSYGLAIDEDDNMFVTIAYKTVAPIVYNSNGSIASNLASFQLPPVGRQAVLIVKYDKSGIAQWAIQAVNANRGAALTTDRRGNVYFTFDFNSQAVLFDKNNQQTPLQYTAQDGNRVIAKCSPSGTITWTATTYGESSPGHPINDIAVDAWTEDVYVCGGYWKYAGLAVRDTTNATNTRIAPIPAKTDIDGFVLKLNNSGVFQWVVRLDGNHDEYVNALITDISGNVYVTGRYGQSRSTTGELTVYNIDGTPGSVSLVPNLSADGQYTQAAFLIKLTSVGKALWGASINSAGFDVGINVGIDSSGCPYIAGGQTDMVGAAVGSRIYNAGKQLSPITIRHPSTNSGLLFLVKFDKEGVAQWVSSIDWNSSYSSVPCTHMAVDPAGNVYLGDYYIGSSPVVYGPGDTPSDIALRTSTSMAAFFVKFKGYPSHTYAPNVVTQCDQKLGLNTINPNATFHMRSANYLVAPSDTYMNRTTAAAFESYSPMQTDERKYVQIGKHPHAVRQAGLLTYVHRNDAATASNNLLSMGFTSNQEVVNLTSDGRVGLNTIHPLTPLHVIGETTVTIADNDIYTLCNNYQRFASQSNQHAYQVITSRTPAKDATLALTHGTLDQRFGGFVKLQGASNKIHIGQIHNHQESNAITVTREQPVPFVGINTHDPTTSLHVTGNTTFTYSNTTLLAEGSNQGFTLRTREALKDFRLLATSNLLIDTSSIGNTRAILSATTGHFGIGLGYEQPQGRVQVRIPGPHDTYMYRLSNAPFESYTNTPIGSNVTLSFGRSNSQNQAATLRYVHSSPASSALSNQLQLGFHGAESNHLNLLSMGYLGFGTTSPQAKLHVIGDAATEYFKATLNGSPQQASFGWFQESNTGWHRPAPARVTHTVTSALVSTSSPSNITTHVDHTFDQQMRMQIDTTDAKNISPLRVASALHNSTDYGPKAAWATMIDGVANDNVQAIATDAQGNIYVLGFYSQGGTDLIVYNSNGQPSSDPIVRIRGTTNQSAAFLVKYDKSGKALWATSLDAARASGTAIAIDTSSPQNIWITGFYWGTPTYYDRNRNPITNITLPSSALNAAYLIKVDGSNGNPVSATVVDQPSGDEKGLAIAIDPRNNVYWGGFYAQDRSGQALAIVKSISQFNQVTEYTSLLRVAIGTSGSFVIKMDSNGTIANAINLDTDGNGQVQITALSLDDEFNLYIAGRYYGQMSVYNASQTAASATLSTVAPVSRTVGQNTQTAFLLKFSDEGKALWASSLNPSQRSEAASIRIDSKNKKAYLTGFYQSSALTSIVEGDGHPSSRTFLRNTTGSAAYLLKYSVQDGRVDWAASIDGASEDFSSDLAIDPFGCLYITGTYTQYAKVYDASGAQSTTAPLRLPQETNTPISTAYVVKYTPDGASLWAINIDSTTADTGVGLVLDPTTCDLLVCGTASASPFFYDANNLQASNSSYITVPQPAAGTASFVVKYTSNFYNLLATSLSDATHNGIQKLLMNADSSNRHSYVNVYASDASFRTIEIPPQTSKNLVWYSGRWRDAQ